MFPTAHGDGVYSDQKGDIEIPVDAGVIGCIQDDDGNVTFDGSFAARARAGVIRFGAMKIDSNW